MLLDIVGLNLAYSELYYVLLGFTRFYWVLVYITGFD